MKKIYYAKNHIDNYNINRTTNIIWYEQYNKLLCLINEQQHVLWNENYNELLQVVNKNKKLMYKQWLYSVIICNRI